MFELTVPLVLFLIMVAIRNKQHAKPVDITYYNAWPLPSAGFVPLMQSFCKPENGIRNEFGFLEYPNATAKDMLEKIEKILNANWSSTWFSNTSAISPYMKNGKPTHNLQLLSRKLAQIMRNNSDVSEENRYVPLNKLIRLKKTANSNNTGPSVDKHFTTEDKVVDLYELFLYSTHTNVNNKNSTTSLYEHLMSYQTDSNATSDDVMLGKETRLDLMHEFFCDKVNFRKVVISKNNDNDLDQLRLCNMSKQELSDLDDNLVISSDSALLSQHEAIPIMDANYLKDLNQKLNNFIDFQVYLVAE